MSIETYINIALGNSKYYKDYIKLCNTPYYTLFTKIHN